MKLDPADLFVSVPFGLAGRCALAWLTVWLGFAVVMGEFSIGPLLLLPLTILGCAVMSGGWIFLTLPLAACLAYRAVDFVRDEGTWGELGLLLLLSLVLCGPSS